MRRKIVIIGEAYDRLLPTPVAHLIFVGGGAIGCCTAYYLTRHSSYDPDEDSILVLEANHIASGSSGKGGGLIARWAKPECLAKPSFSLHQQLADLHDGKQRWGFRRATCADCVMDTTQKTSLGTAGDITNDMDKVNGQVLPPRLDWIDSESVVYYHPVGTQKDTAQCSPPLFANALFEKARDAGAQLTLGTAIRLEISDDGKSLVAVEYIDGADSQRKRVPCTHAVVAAGPWSSNILQEVSVSGARCHSLIFRPNDQLSNDLLFIDVRYRSDDGEHRLTPEVYPRADGTVYVCEAADPTHALPKSSADVVVDSEACDRIFAAATAISQPLRTAEVEKRQVCYQPIVVLEGQRRKLVGPFLGETSIHGVYVACGHDSWGISNAPATGLALSELIFDGKSVSVDIGSLSIPNVMSRAKG